MNTVATTDDTNLKPALASVTDACRYLGGISRAKFYLDIMPKLETIKLGGRRLIVIASIDRLIAALGTEA
jgi:hypothetical protein